METTNCQICGKPITGEPYAIPLGDDHRSFKMCGVCLVSYCEGAHRAMHSHDAAWLARAEIRARVECEICKKPHG